MRQFALFGFLCTFLLAGPACGDEAAIKQMIGDYARAFNDRNLDGVIGFWSESGVHIDRETGERTEGREAIKADLAAAFEENAGATLHGSVDRVRMIKPDVASVEGEVIVSFQGEDPTQTRFHAILVSTNGKWMIDSIEESPIPVADSSYEALQELDWLVGRWVDSGEETRVDTAFRWGSNQTFLLRSFIVTTADGVAVEGTQVIGWDPRSKEIRSWTFQSDGAFGDATWSKSGDDWLVKSSQTLADGQASSGTFVYSKANEDEISIRLIGHEIEGEPQPSGSASSIKRVVEEQPASTTQGNN